MAVTLFMRIPELDLARYDEAMGNLGSIRTHRPG